MIRTCDECYNMRQLHTVTCPNCGKNTAVAQLVGPEYDIKCSSCGYDVIGVSFFPAVDPADPYKDLFIRQGKDYKFTVNYTKKIYYSPDDIKFIRNNPVDICNSDQHDNNSLSNLDIDPIPYLMRHGYDGVGDWVGDIIGVSDEIPEGFTLIEEVYRDD